MQYNFQQAQKNNISQIWDIIEKAILRRKQDGSDQWQDGYPNIQVIENDITKGHGYILTDAHEVVAYCAILINDEPQYKNIDGQWLTDSDFVVYHRVAVSENHVGRGLAQLLLQHIEEFAIQHGIFSLKADTNHDNIGLLRIFEKLGYIQCGEVFFRGKARIAFEKIIKK